MNNKKTKKKILGLNSVKNWPFCLIATEKKIGRNHHFYCSTVIIINVAERRRENPSRNIHSPTNQPSTHPHILHIYRERESERENSNEKTMKKKKVKMKISTMMMMIIIIIMGTNEQKKRIFFLPNSCLCNQQKFSFFFSYSLCKPIIIIITVHGTVKKKKKNFF